MFVLEMSLCISAETPVVALLLIREQSTDACLLCYQALASVADSEPVRAPLLCLDHVQDLTSELRTSWAVEEQLRVSVYWIVRSSCAVRIARS